MRTTATYFAILAGMTAPLTLVSCSPDSPATPPTAVETTVQRQNLQDIQKKYGWVGKYHTDGLAYMYTQLTKGSSRPRSHAELCKIAAKATKEFHKAARRTEIPASLLDPALVGEFCPADTDAGSIRKSIVATIPSAMHPRADMSSAASGLIDQISQLAAMSTSSFAYVSGVQSAEEQAMSLPPDEAGAVVAVGSIALSSLDYWDANLSSWAAIPGIETAYSVSALNMAARTVQSVAAAPSGPRFGHWWQNPYVRGFRRVLGADALAGGRTIYVAWELGPIGWDAAAASALFASGTTAVALLF